MTGSADAYGGRDMRRNAKGDNWDRKVRNNLFSSPSATCKLLKQIRAKCFGRLFHTFQSPQNVIAFVAT